jgi:hypothetical protein
MRRGIHPAAFAAEPLLVPLCVALIVAAVAPSKVAWAAVLVCAAVQTACAWIAMRLLRGRALRWYYAPLEVFRAFVVLFCWARACVSRRIDWRGHPFVVGRDSEISPAPASRWSRLRALVRT